MSCKLCGYLWCYCLYSFMIEINGDKKKKNTFWTAASLLRWSFFAKIVNSLKSLSIFAKKAPL